MKKKIEQAWLQGGLKGSVNLDFKSCAVKRRRRNGVYGFEFKPKTLDDQCEASTLFWEMLGKTWRVTIEEIK